MKLGRVVNGLVGNKYATKWGLVSFMSCSRLKNYQFDSRLSGCGRPKCDNRPRRNKVVYFITQITRRYRKAYVYPVFQFFIHEEV